MIRILKKVVIVYIFIIPFCVKAQCYMEKINQAHALYENGRYKQAHDKYKTALDCDDVASFNNGQEAREGMKKCLPTLTIEGKATFEISVGPDAGEHTFNIQFRRIRTWLIDGGHRQQGIKIDTKELKTDSFRAMWGMNPNTTPRDMKIRLYGVDGATDIDAYVIIHQAAGGLRVNGQRQIKIDFPWEGSVVRCDVTGVAEGQQYEIEGIDTTWMKVQKHSNYFFLIGNTNNSQQSRTRSFVVKNSGTSAIIAINQGGKNTPQKEGRIPIGTFNTPQKQLIPIAIIDKKNKARYGYMNNLGEVIYAPIHYSLNNGLKYKNEWRLFGEISPFVQGYTFLFMDGVYRMDLTGRIEKIFSGQAPMNNWETFENGNVWIEMINGSKGLHEPHFIGVLIDKDGNKLIEVKYNYSEGLLENAIAIYGINPHKKIHPDNAIIRDDGVLISFPQEFKPIYINGIRILVKHSNSEKYGYLDLNGKCVIKPKYEKYNSSNRTFNQFIGEYAMSYIKGKGIGYMDFLGKKTIDHDPLITDARPFEEGLAFIEKGHDIYAIDEEGNKQFQLENLRGLKPIMDDWEDNQYIFQEDRAIVQLREHIDEEKQYVCFVDEKGHYITDSIYDRATLFHSGLAGICKGFEWGFINKQGKVLMNPSEMGTPVFLDGMGLVWNSMGPSFCKKHMKFEFTMPIVDTLGNIIEAHVSPYVKIGEWSEDKATIVVNNAFGFTDTLGQIIIKPQYDSAKTFNEGYALVKIGSKWGYINTEGKMIIPTVFEQAEPFNNGRAEVAIEGKKYWINHKGVIISD